MTPEWEAEHADLYGYAEMRPSSTLASRSDLRVAPYPVDGEEVPGLGFRYVGVPR